MFDAPHRAVRGMQTLPGYLPGAGDADLSRGIQFMKMTKRQQAVQKLLKERKALLLVHYYQRGEIQDIAHILGDSLALSMEAARTDAKVIVFAGVHFMAESASILSPEKTVLLPRVEAGCPLADTITVEELEAVKRKYPGAAVVTYVNSSAAVKAKSDICCTSANAVQVVESLKEAKQVIMAPDGNLARYTARFTKKEIIPWRGYCPVHHLLTVREVLSMKEKHPGAPFAAHPECRGEVLDAAEYIGSTSGILRFARETPAGKVIIGTEMGILHELNKQNRGKEFIPVSEKMICHTMKTITLEDIEQALLEMRYVVEVPDEIRVPANRALSRMLEVRP